MAMAFEIVFGIILLSITILITFDAWMDRNN